MKRLLSGFLCSFIAILIYSCQKDSSAPLSSISGFTPAAGFVAATVTISGNNFSTTPANNIVKFNGTVASVTNSTATSITTTVPPGATTGSITVTTNGHTATSSADFTTLMPDKISGFAPLAGFAETSVTIFGSNFSTTPANNVVKFNGVAASVTSSTSISITTTVPSGATTGPVTVTTNGITAASSSSFIVLMPAKISDFAPIKGVAGTTVTITGINFDTIPGNNAVKFNGIASVVTNSTATSITTTVPSGATTGTIAITVHGRTATSSSDFSIISITGMSVGQAREGTAITIYGTNFDPSPANNLVKFNGTTAPVVSASATQLVAVVPTGTTNGPVTVTIDGLTATSPNSFTVLGPRLNPTSGPVGTLVTITGSLFDPIAYNDIIYFAGTSVKASTATSTQLTFTVQPTTIIGNFTGNVQITANGILIPLSPQFTIAPYTITGISPINGPAGTTVTITGTGFDPDPANNYIAFGNPDSQTIHPATASTTQLTFVVPDSMPSVSSIMLSTDGFMYATGPLFVLTSY